VLTHVSVIVRLRHIGSSRRECRSSERKQQDETEGRVDPRVFIKNRNSSNSSGNSDSNSDSVVVVVEPSRARVHASDVRDTRRRSSGKQEEEAEEEEEEGRRRRRR